MRYFRFYTLAIALMMVFAYGQSAESSREKVIFNFQDTTLSASWNIINDGVMGGVSSSAFRVSVDAGGAVFSGNLSLENNGGFASVRTFSRNFQLEGFRGVALRVKGDGNTYSFRLWTNDNFDGISYQAKFKTVKGKWMEVVLPFSDFVPTFRGRVLRDVPQLQPQKIQQIGILIADKQSGRFELLIEWIKATGA